MPLLDVVGQILEDAGIGTLATDLFLSRMPDAPDVCWTVYEFESLDPDEPFSGFGIDRPGLQVVTRAAREDYPTARDNLILARDVLADIAEYESGTNILHRVRPLGSVIPLEFDINLRPRLALNFQVWWT